MTLECRARRQPGQVGLLLASLLLTAACSSSKSKAPSGDSAPSDIAPSLLARDLGSGRCVAVSSRGQIVGVDVNDATFVITPGGRRSILASSGPKEVVNGVGIDDAGRVVGSVTNEQGRQAAVFQDGAWTVLAALGARAEALSVSPDGVVGGAAYVVAGTPLGALVDEGGAIDVAWPKTLGSAVYASAGSDHFAGILETEQGATHAFVNDGRTLRDLGTLGGKSSAALGINPRGDVVGTAELAGGQRHAFVWRPGMAQVLDLSRKSRPLDDARGIDNDGSIIANAAAPNGAESAWLLRDGAEPIELRAVDASGVPLLSVHAAAIRAGHVVGWGVVAAEEEQQPVRCLAWTVQP